MLAVEETQPVKAGAPTVALAKLVELVDSSRPRIEAIEASIVALEKSIQHDRRNTGTMVDFLVDGMKTALMVPFTSFLESFPKHVRDLRGSRERRSSLFSRADVEIDRRIPEQLKDAFIHLLRNCVDHGIERPDQREKAGKTRRGTIIIEISQSGGRVQIAVSDDGAGIDVEKLKQTAVANNFISDTQAANLTQEQALSLVYRSGLSTSPMITQISGRGLGLAIARDKVEKLGGRITIDSSPAGTSFHMLLPLTLATFRGVLLKVSGRDFVIPTAGVERVIAIKPQDLITIENRLTIRLADKGVSFVRLGDVLGLTPLPQDAAHAHAGRHRAYGGRSAHRVWRRPDHQRAGGDVEAD